MMDDNSKTNFTCLNFLPSRYYEFVKNKNNLES